MKHVANIITAVRIVAAVLMLFVAPLSFGFFILYTIGGVSDMIDGTVARKLGFSGNFGAKLDSIADLLFFLSALFKVLPVLWDMFPAFALWSVIFIAITKSVSAVVGIVRFRKLCFLHTRLNKIAGAAVFLLPYFYSHGCFVSIICVACAVAFLAATEECICLLKMHEYDAETKGILS